MLNMNTRHISALTLIVILGVSAGALFFYSTSLNSSYSKYLFPLWSLPLLGDEVYDDVRVGDLNSDGLDDVVVSGHSSLDIAFQNTTGKFENRTKLLLGETFGGFVLEDLNGDSTLDICSRNGTDIVTLFNDGSGNFDRTFRYSFPEMDAAHKVFSLRWENASVPGVGVLMTDSLRDCVMVMSNNGTGNLAVRTYFLLAPGRNTLDILTGDLNNDDKEEVIVVQDNGNLTAWSPSSSPRWYVNVSQHLMPASNAWLIVTDVNGDGVDDIGLASNLGWANGMLVFFSEESMELEQPFLEKHYNHSWLGVCAADLDEDSDEDIVLCTEQDSIVVIGNDETGQIRSEIEFSGFIDPHSPAVITLDGHPFPAIVFIAQHAEYYDMNAMDLVVIWKDESPILP